MWDVMRAVSWCIIHLVAGYVLVWNHCHFPVTVFFNCGLPSFVRFQEFSGCGTWLFFPYNLLRGVTVFTYLRGEYVLWNGAVCPRAWALGGF
jgi:hypothetical protein